MQNTTNQNSPSVAGEETPSDINLIVGSAQIVLAEKRTSLSLLRTAIAVCALPLAVLSTLIATSKYYNATDVLHLLIPVMLFSAALLLLGAYLVVRAVRRIHHQDKMIREIKRTHPVLAPYID